MTADHTPERLSAEERGTDPSGGAVEVWIDLDLGYPDPPDVVTLGENGPYYRPGDMGYDLGVALMRARAERDRLAAHLADVEARLAAAGGVLRRWDDVLAECKQADPRWILDQGVMALETARNELRAALHPDPSEVARDE